MKRDYTTPEMMIAVIAESDVIMASGLTSMDEEILGSDSMKEITVNVK